MTTHRYSKKLEHYCYLRWRKAQGRNRKYELFWINMHLKAGDLK